MFKIRNWGKNLKLKNMWKKEILFIEVGIKVKKLYVLENKDINFKKNELYRVKG